MIYGKVDAIKLALKEGLATPSTTPKMTTSCSSLPASIYYYK